VEERVRRGVTFWKGVLVADEKQLSWLTTSQPMHRLDRDRIRDSSVNE